MTPTPFKYSNMKRTYQRSPILSFHELTSEQVVIAVDRLGDDLAQDSSYVLWNNEPLPLCMFIRTNNSLFSGVYGQSAFSAYFIKINEANEQATVVYSYC